MHRLVAKYFCKGYSKYKVVNHKDGNRKNNNFKNLEWVSHSENLKHGHKTLGSRSRACKFYGGRYIQRIKTTGKYSAVFYYFGERYHLGSFDSEKIAEKVLNDVRKSHGLKSGDYLC